MANLVKAGPWFFRINPDNLKDLQRSTNERGGFSRVWSCPIPGRILDLSSAGDDVIIYTTEGDFRRTKMGNVVKL